MKLKEWGAFWLLAMVWGTSFLWIKIAVGEISPFMLVALRFLFGFAGLFAVMQITRQPFPRDLALWSRFLFMAVFNMVVPITLISWGETKIESSLAAILNGTVPLWTIIIAHFVLHDEKITPARILGLFVGFAGVVILVSRDLAPEGLTGDVFGQLAVVGAAVSYAVSATFSRRYLRGQSPVIQAALVLLLADAMMWLITPAVESPLRLPALSITWFAIAWLGLLGSCLAFWLYYYLINNIGPTRTSLVTYVFPVIGLVLGIVFLGEVADWRLLIGSFFVVVGIVVVNLIPNFSLQRYLCWISRKAESE